MSIGSVLGAAANFAVEAGAKLPPLGMLEMRARELPTRRASSVALTRCSWTVPALYADYCASKAGLSHLTSVLTLELGHLGVRCNAIAPGPVATPMMSFADDMATYRKYTQEISERRFSTPEEQAKVVLFLASDDASYVNGETIRVDGGWMLGMWPDPAQQPDY